MIRGNRFRHFKISLLALLLLGALGQYWYLYKQSLGKHEALSKQAFRAYKDYVNFTRSCCYDFGKEAATESVEYDYDIVVVGDSYAQDYMAALKITGQLNGLKVYFHYVPVNCLLTAFGSLELSVGCSEYAVSSKDLVNTIVKVDELWVAAKWDHTEMPIRTINALKLEL